MEKLGKTEQVAHDTSKSAEITPVGAAGAGDAGEEAVDAGDSGEDTVGAGDAGEDTVDAGDAGEDTVTASPQEHKHMDEFWREMMLAYDTSKSAETILVGAAEADDEDT
eukprot:gene18447-24926_t